LCFEIHPYMGDKQFVAWPWPDLENLQVRILPHLKTNLESCQHD